MAKLGVSRQVLAGMLREHGEDALAERATTLSDDQLRGSERARSPARQASSPTTTTGDFIRTIPKRPRLVPALLQPRISGPTAGEALRAGVVQKQQCRGARWW
jgi:hypothetical protein